MKNIKLLNKISPAGTKLFDPAKYNVAEDIENPDGIMVRSAVMHDMEFGSNLRAIARAGAGVNNIPLDRCAEAGIVVFNTPGANANGVKELTIAALLLASRDIVPGVEWAESLKGQEGAAKLVEKGKSKFAGHEIAGKTLGVIGLGAIGGMVANAAIHLGMKVMGFDPYVSVDAAWSLSHHVVKAASYDDLYKNCDYITIHVPSTPETKGMICAEKFAMMKDGVRIVNLARADLVNSEDMKAALESGKVARDVTDFPTDEMIGVEHVVTIPHLGASTEEAEDNCAAMAANELMDFLENGNIRNSVNFPNVIVPHTGDARICVLHKNVPSMLSQITKVISDDNVNIENLVNRSRGDYAYTLVEVKGEVPSDITDKITAMENIIRVNVI